MKKFLFFAAGLLVFCFLFLASGKVMAMDAYSPNELTKISLTSNKTTAVADGSDTISFWYGAYFVGTMPIPEYRDCGMGSSMANPFPATTNTVDGQLCRAAAFSSKMNLSISGSGNNVSPNPLGGSGGILPDYNLISGTGEFTLKSSTAGEKVVTYSASSLLPGGATMTISMTVNFTQNIAGGDNITQNTAGGTNSQVSSSGSGQIAPGNSSGVSQGTGSAPATSTTTTAVTENNQAGTTVSTESTENNSVASIPNLIYYISGAVLILLIALFLFWLLYLKKKSSVSSDLLAKKLSNARVLGIFAAVLLIIFIAATGWLFFQNMNLVSGKEKAETELATVKSDLEKSQAAKDEKMTGVANKLEAMSLIFGENAREKNNFERAGALITAMNSEALNADWAAMQTSRGQATGEKLISDLIAAASKDLK